MPRNVTLLEVSDVPGSRRLALILPVVACIAHALRFTGYCLDDAYISFRYARHLATGLGLTFNVGERVEGYTNLSWVLLLALGERMSVPSILLAPPLGLACAIGLTITTVRTARTLAPELPAAGAIAGMLVAGFTGVAFYATTGLESVLFAWLALLALHACVRRAALPLAGWSLLAILTRPEGALVACLCFARLWLARSEAPSEVQGEDRHARHFGLASALLAGGIVVYAAFKLAYFGALLPNTFHAKTPELASGLRYLATAWPLLGVCAWAGFRARGEARVIAMLFVPCVAAIAWEGGDWMPGERLFVPFMPWIAVAADGSMLTALGRARSGARRAFVAACASLLMFFLPQGLHSLRLAILGRGSASADEARAYVFAGLLAADVDVVAAHDIGLLGDFMRDAFIVDLGGLVDREIAGTPGGYGAKQPSLSYLERKRPQALLIASLPQADAQAEIDPLFPVERYVLKSAWLREHYRLTGTFPCSSSYVLHVFRRR